MLTLKNVTTGYIKTKPILTDFNYTFEDNKIYGILGQSGCGKTTLLKTIAQLIAPLQGEVQQSDTENVYMMFQNYTSFDWLTCLDNILIAKKIQHLHILNEDKKEAMSLLEKVGLDQCSNYFPTQLSGGMRQRLALARTIYTKPKYILMDEPLSALDENTRIQMQDLILDYHKETHNTIIMVTHSSAEAQRMCETIINL